MDNNPNFPYTQIRIARPVRNLMRTTEFYKAGLGLAEIGSFRDHDGINGVMLGMPDGQHHLEFTEHQPEAAYPPPTGHNLLVFYLADAAHRDAAVQRLAGLGYQPVPPENPYWEKHGITIPDPDGWRIVLMDVPGFEVPGKAVTVTTATL